MHNFWRAIQTTFKYKWNIVGVVVSSLCLALCWGGNIATVYPLVQVSFQGDSVSSYLDKEVVAQGERIEKLKSELKLAELDPDESRRVSLLTSQIESAEKLLDKYRRLQPIARRWTPDDPFLTVAMLMAFVFVATLIKGVCTFAHGVLSTRLGQLGSYELRSLFFKRMLAYEVDRFSQRGLADATSRFTSDMGQLSGGLTLVYGKTIREPLKMIVCVVGAALVSWRLLLFTCLFVPLAAIAIRWLAKSLKRVVRKSMQEMALLYGRIEETFRAIRVVKSFNREALETAKFQRTNKTYFERGMKTAKYDSLTSPITECLGIAMLVFAILCGAYLVIKQQTTLFGIPMSANPLDLGSLILFYGFLIGASDPARRLTDIFANIQAACVAADRVYEIIDRDVPIKNPANPKTLGEFKEKIVFDGVCYEYPIETPLAPPPEPRRKKIRLEDVLKERFARWREARRAKKSGAASNAVRNAALESSAAEKSGVATGVETDKTGKIGKEARTVLKNVSFEVKFGETLAIVGPSGCGKSTLLSTIPRFIDPTRGTVSFDGISLKELKTSDVRDQIGLVAQDSVLFNESVFENIRYGKPGATREEVVEAARKANADDFIQNELADGYETVVGPGGGRLSGGQRQRIALARAILKNPRILLLDEATSQIDLQSERCIHRALKNYVGGRTTILVTHRLSALALADRIVVMQDGVVQYIGTREDALKNSPFFANLWATENFDEGDDPTVAELDARLANR